MQSNNVYGGMTSSYGKAPANAGHDNYHSEEYTSISEDANSLKLKLSETVSRCQDLLRTLNERQEFSLGAGVQKLSVSPTAGGISAPELMQLKNQINTLEAQLSEVTQINNDWQKYSRQLEETIETQKRELEQSRKLGQSTLQMTEEQQQAVDRLMMQYKQKFKNLEDEKLKIEDENRQYRVTVAQLTSKLEEHEKSTKQLREQQAALLKEHRQQLPSPPKAMPPKAMPPQSSGAASRAHSSLDVNEQLEVLKQQVQMYCEDFQSERRDRERAQSRIDELENELQIKNVLLEEFQTGRSEALHERRQQAMLEQQHQYYRGRGLPLPAAQNNALSPADRSHNRRVQGRIQCDSGLDEINSVEMDDAMEGFDEVDGPAPRPVGNIPIMNSKTTSR